MPPSEEESRVAMISVRSLRKSIRNGNRTVDILKGIDFEIPRGQFAAIMGSSGWTRQLRVMCW
jgi:putative ABC transport system ATP-binding protein